MKRVAQAEHRLGWDTYLGYFLEDAAGNRYLFRYDRGGRPGWEPLQEALLEDAA